MSPIAHHALSKKSRNFWKNSLGSLFQHCVCKSNYVCKHKVMRRALFNGLLANFYSVQEWCANGDTPRRTSDLHKNDGAISIYLQSYAVIVKNRAINYWHQNSLQWHWVRGWNTVVWVARFISLYALKGKNCNKKRHGLYNNLFSDMVAQLWLLLDKLLQGNSYPRVWKSTTCNNVQKKSGQGVSSTTCDCLLTRCQRLDYSYLGSFSYSD